MAVAALEQITSWGVARIAAALARTTAVIAQGSEQLGFASPPADQRGPHILGVRLPEDIRGRVVPALAEANCFAAVRGGSLRIAPHLQNNDRDIEKLTAALGAAIDRGPKRAT